jgi:hypothetical protein
MRKVKLFALNCSMKARSPGCARQKPAPVAPLMPLSQRQRNAKSEAPSTAARGRMRLLRYPLQGRNELVWIEPKDFRERHEFHDSDASLSTFEAGDEGPRFP